MVTKIFKRLGIMDRMRKQTFSVYNQPGTYGIIDLDTGAVVSTGGALMTFRSLSVARNFFPECQYAHFDKKLDIKQLKKTFLQNANVDYMKDIKITKRERRKYTKN